MTDAHWPYRYDLLLRLRLIEIVALWEGRLTTKHLCDYFGIRRQQASKDIKKYLEEIAPENLIYDSSQKGYLPSPEFSPRLTQGTAEEYLHLLERNSDLNLHFERLDLGFGHCHQLPLPNRSISADILRPIIKACHNNLRLEVDYRSINDPKPDGRVIAPHSLVFAANRWHVRAYCEKNQSFRDFVLTRFFEAPEIEDAKSTKTESDDVNWNQYITVILIPDRRLTHEQQAVIECDYGMDNGKLEITIRASLIAYLLRSLNIDIHTINADPKAQQIVIDNLDLIRPWVFD
ncbi:helix-turn-helix transcriptional regulator [Psychrosphaera aestuarii]|uniref:helix-turn-helix transcriptional regulator n=1 Tax=Psychrosphaera aestuarii TaxID=1266052 RepID=UPI001B3248D5|nr:WYL domain-containing protein [Psychrosphaera aestuarii]